MKNFRNASQLGDALLVIYCQKEFNCKNPNPSFFGKRKEEGVNEIVLNKDNVLFNFGQEIYFPEEELLLNPELKKLYSKNGFSFFVKMPVKSAK